MELGLIFLLMLWCLDHVRYPLCQLNRFESMAGWRQGKKDADQSQLAAGWHRESDALEHLHIRSGGIGEPSGSDQARLGHNQILAVKLPQTPMASVRTIRKAQT